VTVLATQCEIDVLADRIERAYRRSRPGWRGDCSTSRVWAAAALNLLQSHETHPAVPTDPELFVAAQPTDPAYPDPWVELTQPDAVRGYRRRIREIIRGLHKELAGEIEFAEDRVVAGQAIRKVLTSHSSRLSPLGRYIVAQRAGRVVLSNRFLDDAVCQHQGCPLYRQASQGLLPMGVYPVPEEATAPAASTPTQSLGRSRAQALLN
jgi:hypothetical protein